MGMRYITLTLTLTTRPIECGSSEVEVNGVENIVIDVIDNGIIDLTSGLTDHVTSYLLSDSACHQPSPV